jgi:hypothetical protein
MLNRCIILIILLSPALAVAAAVDVGSRVEMFVDEHLIERKQNADLRLNPPTKREVVLAMDQPGEGPTSAYFTVFRDGDIIRMYYRGDPDRLTLYAESKDGIHFTRPQLGLFEFKGTKQNNIVYDGLESHAFAPFRDDNPAAKPEQRYKALAYRPKRGALGLVAFSSPDAIHWTMMQQEPVTTKGQFDSLNTVSWDASEKRYRCFSRYWNAGEFKGVRAIQSMTSEDFLHWNEPVAHQYAAGVPIEHFYTNATVRCPGAEHMWLSFPMRFVPERKKIAAHPEPALTDAVFMSSRDAVHWDRAFLEAWVRPDLDQENWTERSNMPAWGIIPTPGDENEFSMYISEHYRWPSNRLRRLTIPRHRFASIHAGASKGEVVTKPLTFTGDQLQLNYATSAAGSVVVEVQDESGKPLAGFAEADAQPVYGNEFDAKVQWKCGDLSQLAGKAIRLRFVLADADVYALKFTPAR